MTVFRLAILAVPFAVSACAAPNTLPHTDGSLDGVYAGHRTIDQSCGTRSQPIVFHVSGSEISVYSHHKRHRLEGTVGANGQVALSDIGRHRRIEGQITGDRLIATEQDQPSNKKAHKALDTYDPLGDACLWRFEAIRTAQAQEEE